MQNILPKYAIKLAQDHTPYIAPMARLSPEKEKILENEVQDLLNRGLIERGDGSWRARVVLVRKKDGKWRRCIDYRILNDMTIPDSYPMVRIDDALDQLGKAKYFTKLDLVEGFYQIPLQDESKDYTGFATKSGFYRWKYLPMGFRNASSEFQRQMDNVLLDYRFKFVIPYIDDLLIFSNTYEEHLKHIELVLERLRSYGVFVKLSKCEFFMKKLNFLGHQISDQGISPNSDKVKAISEMSIPNDPKVLIRFLAMAGFYRRYIAGFAKRTHHLRELCKMDAVWNWKDIHSSEFNDIKNALISSPVMAYPDWGEKFILTTDASLLGLGAVLSQSYLQGERVIAYASRVLQSAEKNYTITELEAQAVVWSTNLFKVYLEDKPFDLITDHKALTSFHKIKETNPRLERWSIKLSRFNYNVIYRKGVELVNADCLSRNIGVVLSIVEEIRVRQSEDESLNNIRKIINERGIIEFILNEEEVMEPISMYQVAVNQYYIVMRGKLYHRLINTRGEVTDRIIVPKSLRSKVLEEIHNSGHFDFKRTYDKVRKRYYWQGMVKDTLLFVKSCIRCQQRNPTEPFKRGKMFSVKAYSKLELIGIDLLKGIPTGSITGSNTILIITDYFTKFTMGITLREPTSREVAEALYQRWVCVFGAMESIISDEGGEFSSKEIVNDLYEIFKLKKLTTTSYHPQTNGQCERFNRTLVGMLAKYIDDYQGEWELYLDTCILHYNSSRHSVTQESPLFLFLGQEAKLPMDLEYDREDELRSLNTSERGGSIRERLGEAIKRIKKSQEDNKERYDKNRSDEVFEVGDFVMWRKEPRTSMEKEVHRKLISSWFGPVEIYKVLGENKYETIDDEDKLTIFNCRNLKLYVKKPEWIKVRENQGNDRYMEVEQDINKSVEQVEKEMEIEVGKNSNEEMGIEEKVEEMEVIENKDKSGNIDIEEAQSGNENKEKVEAAKGGNRRSARNKKYIPKKKDLVDVNYRVRKGSDSIKRWYCGEVIEVDEEEEQRFKIAFLDGDEGWFDMRDEELQIRRCIESRDHHRSDKPSIMTVADKGTKSSRRKEKRVEIKKKNNNNKNNDNNNNSK
jgi:hypothetical protein